MIVFRYVGALALLALAAPAAAKAAPLACGATITSSVQLDADLRDCPGDGLVIGADRITLDLGRSTVDGTGAGTGIRLAGHRGVTIKGGTVREFASGIVLDDADDNRVTGVAVRAVAGRGIDVLNGSDDNLFDGLASKGNRTGLAITDSSGNEVRGSALSDNAVTGMLVFGASQNLVRDNWVYNNAGNGVAFVEGSKQNTAVGNTVRGAETGLIVDSSDRNVFSGNHVSGSGDGVLVAGDGNVVRGNTVHRAVSGCETCSGFGIGVLSGDDNVLKANVVTRSLSDGINVAARSTWIGSNVSLRNGKLGIRAVSGVRDGGRNRSDSCKGVTCRKR